MNSGPLEEQGSAPNLGAAAAAPAAMALVAFLAERCALKAQTDTVTVGRG